MATLEDLEAALLAAWTPENLQVYGDHLMSLGDPRGELISVDQHAEEHGADRDVAHRKRRALRAWLGLPADAEIRGVFAKTRFANGFVEDLEIDEIDRILSTPAGKFVRSVDLHNKIPVINTAVEQLASEPRPWLQRITIWPRYQREPVRKWTTEPARIPGFARLVAAAPNLERLDIRGHELVGAFAHPKLTELRVYGFNAMRSLVDDSALLPAVKKLSLGISMLNELQPSALNPAGLPTLAGLPNLRELDLGPNEAAHRHSAIHEAAFATLLGCKQLAQLERVRVPQIRNAIELGHMQKALDRMPALRELHILRARTTGPSLEHPTAQIEIEHVPWPPLTSSKAQGWIDLTLPNTKPRHSVWLPTEVHQMTLVYRDLDARARASWARFWDVVEQLDDGDSEELSVQTMLDALDRMKLDHRTHATWIAVRDILRRSVSTDRVMMARRRR